MNLYNKFRQFGVSVTRFIINFEYRQHFKKYYVIYKNEITFLLFVSVLLVPLSASVNLNGQLGFLHKKISVDAQDGGFIDEIMVIDGQHVTKGEILARLVEPRMNAELTALINALGVKICRLARYDQQINGGEFHINDSYHLLSQANTFNYCKSEAETSKGLIKNYSDKLIIINNQINQLKEDINLLHDSLKNEKRRLEIQESLYRKRKELVDQNFYSEAALLEQESLLIAARQNLATKQMELSDKKNRLLDATKQKSDFQSDYFDRNRSERSQLISEIESQYASYIASLKYNKNMTIVAPETGYINKLNKARQGLLLSPRETLLEIVPSSEDMIAIASYKPTDHSNIYVGQEATVRLMTLNQSIAPEFKGNVISLSPDIKQNSPLDQPVYDAMISFGCNDECKKEHHLTAGVPVEVYVLGAKRSLLSYLINTLYKASKQTLSEPN